MMFGILSSGSLMLSEIGRRLEEPIELLYTEKRLSRGLNSDRLDDAAIDAAHLELASTMTLRHQGEGVVIAVDYTDISKPYANLDPNRGMEGICYCWNGSDSRKGPGYPVVQIEATLPGGNQFPLCMRPFSYRGESFQSQNTEFLNDIQRVSRYVGDRAWWVFDRGFDGNAILNGLCRMNLRWICRLQISTPDNRNPSERKLMMGGEPLQVYPAALQCIPRYTINIQRSRKWQRRTGKKSLKVEIGSRKVWLTKGGASVGQKHYRKRGEPHTLIVIWGFGKRPTVLMASEYLQGKNDVVDAVQAYLRRWKAEEATRAAKDSRAWGVRMEDVRALTLRGVRRMIQFAVLVYTFIAVLRERSARLIQRAFDTIRAFKAHLLKDPRYRIFRGISVCLQKTTYRRRKRWRKPPDH